MEIGLTATNQTKLKHFLWRCIHGWLDTASVVKGRGIPAYDICCRYGLVSETREHLFFHCMEFALIWKLAPIQWDGLHQLTWSFVDWWRAICLVAKGATFQKRMKITVHILWYI